MLLKETLQPKADIVHQPEHREVLATGSIERLNYFPLKSGAGIGTEILYIGETGPYMDREFMIATPDGKFVSQREKPEMAKIRSKIEGDYIIFSYPGHPDLMIHLQQPGVNELIVKIWNENVDVTVEEVGQNANEWFQKILGLSDGHKLVRQSKKTPRPLSQTWIDKPEATVSLADGYPLLLTNESSHQALNVAGLPEDRWRGNINVKGFDAWAEDTWKVIKIGEVIFDVVKPCGRCPIPMIDQHTGERAQKGETLFGQPLKALAPIRRIETVTENAGVNDFAEKLKGKDVYFGWYLVPRNKGIININDKVEVLEKRQAA